MLAYRLLLFLAGFCACSLTFGCDIFVANKCPTPSAEADYSQNYTLYCKQIKDHVDCINKKLKQCKRVQEYGPALETIKQLTTVIILQGKTHGCEGLIDKIRLPRIQRKKPTTWTSASVTSSSAPVEEQHSVVCAPNMTDIYCQRLEPALMSHLFAPGLSGESLTQQQLSLLDASSCARALRFADCVQTNLRIRCQKSLSVMFGRISALSRLCQQQASDLRLTRNLATTHRQNNDTFVSVALLSFLISTALFA